MSDLIQYFFSPAQPLGLLFNVGIFAVGLSGAIAVFMAWRKVQAEESALAQYMTSVDGAQVADEFAGAARRLPEGGILRKRLTTLEELHRLGDEVHHASLSAIALSRLDRELAYARWASSVVVLLGLGGTLVGLSLAVWRAQGLIEAAVTQAEATSALIATFAGLQTAFSTTLAGIIFAVVLGLLISRYRQRQSRYLEALEQFTVQRLLPRFRTSPALAMTQAVQKLAALEVQMDSSLREVIDQLNLRGRALSASVEEGLSGVVTELQGRGVALTNTIDKSFADLTNETRDGHQALLGRYAEAHSALARFLGAPEEAVPTIAENLSALQRGVGAIEQATTSYLRLVPALEEVIARQVDRQSRDLHETMHGYVGRLAEGVERQDAIVSDGLRTLQELLPKFGEAVGQAQRRQLEAIDATLETHTDLLRDTIVQQTHGAQALSEATRALHAAAQELTRAGGSEDREILRRIAESIEVTQRELVAFVRTQPRRHDGVPQTGWSSPVAAAAAPDGREGRSDGPVASDSSPTRPSTVPSGKDHDHGGSSEASGPSKRRSLLDRWFGGGR